MGIEKTAAPKLDKRAQLVAWALVHRVPVLAEVTPGDLARACAWFRLPVSNWEALALSQTALLANVEAKRARRRAWALEHGSVPDGWTPPDPLRPKTKQRGSPRQPNLTPAERHTEKLRRHKQHWMQKRVGFWTGKG